MIESERQDEASQWQDRQDACKRDFKVMPRVEWEARWRDFCRQAVEAEAKSGSE